MKKAKMKPLEVEQILFVILMFSLIDSDVFALGINRVAPNIIMLGHQSLVVEHVPINAELQLTCRLTTPIWYRHDKLWSHERTLTVAQVKFEDAGLYACYTPSELHGLKWSNLSLIVDDEDDIADFSKVEDEIVLKLQQQQDESDELKSYTHHIISTSLNSNQTMAETESKPSFWRADKFKRLLQKPVGSMLQLNCPGLGNPMPNITWTLNDLDIQSNAKLKKWSMTIEELQLTDAGLYKCQLCNYLGCINHTTKLSIYERLREAPLISAETLHNQSVAQGESTFFECHVSSDLEPHIVWIKHSVVNSTISELEASLRALNSYAAGAHNSNFNVLSSDPDAPQLLRFPHVHPSDIGWYTCIAANSVGRSIASAYLNIQENADEPKLETTTEKSANKSKFVKHMSKMKSPNLEFDDPEPQIDNDHDIDTADKDNDAIVEESAPKFKKSDRLVNFIHKPSGSSIQIICPAVGNPMPNITWTRNDTEIARHIGKVNYKKWSINMEDAITEDSGAYKCKLCNKLGCIEHTTKLTIVDRLRTRPIHSDKYPQNQTVLTNSSAYFECRVVSDVEAHFMWIRYTHRNNETIKQLEESVPTLSNNMGDKYAKDFVQLRTDPDESQVLRLANVTHADEGWYTCVAGSSLGQSVASAYLKVVDKLPTREVHTLLRGHPIWISVVAIVVVLLFLMGSIFIVYVLRKLKHEKLLKHRIETVHQWTKKVIIYKPLSSENSSCDLQMPVIKIEKQRTTFQTSSNLDPTQAFNEYEFPLDSNWEIPRSQLALGSTLGEGAFGRVVMAEACGLSRSVASSPSNSTIVAVKMVKEEHTDADMASLVREMEVMKMIGKHINIINLLGCCSQNGPLWVIVEFAPHGNLKDFLKKNRPLSVSSPRSLQRYSGYLEDRPPQLTEKHLISFAFQIARGMEYLASRRCIHRDLAARNVLVSDDYVMKIADFGLARDIQDTDYYRKNTNGRLPIKWMAPESLQEKFYDSQSDVWSYGVLLWEIMTYGEQPYPNVMSAEELYSYLITGQRMEKPPRCSLNIYMLMRQCWHFDSSARPTFVEIVENLDKILQLATNISSNEEYLDLSMPMLETPPSSSDDDSEAETLKESSPLRYQYTYKFK